MDALQKMLKHQIKNIIFEVFSENGAKVFACVRKVDEEFKSHADELNKKFNNEIIPIQFDLSNDTQIKEAANNILSSNKPIDILVNNAAAIHTAIFQMTSIKKLKPSFLKGVFFYFFLR